MDYLIGFFAFLIPIFIVGGLLLILNYYIKRRDIKDVQKESENEVDLFLQRLKETGNYKRKKYLLPAWAKKFLILSISLFLFIQLFNYFYEYFYESGSKEPEVTLTAEEHFNEGVKYQELEEYREAIKHFLKVISIDPNYCDAYLGISRCYFSQNKRNKYNHYHSLWDDCTTAIINKNMASANKRIEEFKKKRIEDRATRSKEIDSLFSITFIKNTFSLKNGDSPYDNYFGKGKYDSKSLHSISFKNGNSTDAIVCLVKVSTNKTIRNEYIRASTNFKMIEIPDGKYYLKVFFGNGWNSTLSIANTKIKGSFDHNISFSKYDSNSDLFNLIQYEQNDKIFYSEYNVTLYPVSNGNMESEEISSIEFFNNLE